MQQSGKWWGKGAVMLEVETLALKRNDRLIIKFLDDSGGAKQAQLFSRKTQLAADYL